MEIKFKISLIEEFKEWLDLYKNREIVLQEPSVYFPRPFKTLLIVPFYFNRRKVIRKMKSLWEPHEREVQKFWEKAELKELGEVTCFMHLFGYMGWFDTGKNYIYLRYDKYQRDNDLGGTILHELLHLATRTSSMTYEEWEAEVDKYADLAKKMTGLVIRPWVT